MLSKKVVIIFVFLLFFSNAYTVTLSDLLESALQNNADIVSAQKTYDNAVLSSKTLNGELAPSVNVSSSATLPDGYNWDKAPDSFSSNISVSQPLFSGTTISAIGLYSYNIATMNEKRYISQSPNISFSLTQSLFPFWLQGKLKDPSILSLRLQKKYYYSQLLYTKKTVLQNLIQNYIYALVYKNEITIYQNSINLLDEQIKAFKQLKDSGNTNQAKILEMENSKWNYQQNLMNAFSNYEGYLQNIKTICGCNFDDSDNYFSFGSESLNEDKIIRLINNSLDNIADPLEETYKLRLEILNANRTLEKQNSAPTLTVSIQPSWTLDVTKSEEWKKSWNNLGSPSSWNTSISINFSPLISGIAKQNKKRFENDYAAVEKSYNSYLAQKKFVHQQYDSLREHYENQLNSVSKLFSEGRKELEDHAQQFSVGAISQLDYESMRISVENCGLSKNCIELYLWLYQTLILMN